LKKIFYEKAMQIRKEFADDDAKNDSIFEFDFPKINQAKIVRDKERTNAKGVGRSKRYGFVEFREHSDAMLVLRALNNKSCSQIFSSKNNEATNDKLGKLSIEFSVEDMKKLWTHKLKTQTHQRKFKNENLERLHSKLEILNAQNQHEEARVVEAKINKIKSDFEIEQRQKEKEQRQKVKAMSTSKQKPFYKKKPIKKIRRRKIKKRGNVKRA